MKIKRFTLINDIEDSGFSVTDLSTEGDGSKKILDKESRGK